MQRYFIAPEQWNGASVRITGDDAHHLARVMRAKPGDQCIVSDGETREALVRLETVDSSEVTGEVAELLPMDREPQVEVWIAQSLPKGDKMELVIQKGTEIGAARFYPFTSERTVVQLDGKKEGKKWERWGKIAKEAAEQAHRSRIPSVEPLRSWKELMKLAGEADAAWFCYEKQTEQSLRSQVRAALAAYRASAPGEDNAPCRLLLIIGPEGGFSEREAAEAEAAGCSAVGLGKRILRTETAAMVGLTCILYEAGEMGGEE